MPDLVTIRCAIAGGDLDGYAVVRAALDAGRFFNRGLNVELDISRDGHDAVAAVLERRADLALTTTEAVVDALLDREPLAVFNVFCGRAVACHEATFLDTPGLAARMVELLAVIADDLGRVIVNGRA